MIFSKKVCVLRSSQIGHLPHRSAAATAPGTSRALSQHLSPAPGCNLAERSRLQELEDGEAAAGHAAASLAAHEWAQQVPNVGSGLAEGSTLLPRTDKAH